MQRRDFLRSAAAGLTASTIATPAVAQDMPQIRWRLAAGLERSPSAVQSGADIFARQLGELTDGRFQIEVLANGERPPGMPNFDTVVEGRLEMAFGLASDCFRKDPTFAIAAAVPFGLSGRRQRDWLLESGNDAFNQFCGKFGVYALPMGNAGVQIGGWYRKEIGSVADLARLRLAASGMTGLVLTKLGALPQALPTAELRAALGRSDIDGVEGIDPGGEALADLVQVAPYYYSPGLGAGAASLHLFINLDQWNGLSKAYQSAIANAAAYADSHLQAAADASAAGALKSLVARGARLRSFPRDITNAGYQAANVLYAEISAVNPDFKTMIESMMVFRDDAFLWSQVVAYSDGAVLPRAPNMIL